VLWGGGGGGLRGKLRTIYLSIYSRGFPLESKQGTRQHDAEGPGSRRPTCACQRVKKRKRKQCTSHIELSSEMIQIVSSICLSFSL